MNKDAVKNSLAMFCGVIVVSFIAIKYIKNINGVSKLFFEEAPQFYLSRGYINSCRVLEQESTKLDDENNIVFYVGVRLQDNDLNYPFKLNDKNKFIMLKNICEEKAYVKIEYTALNKKLERNGIYHVNQIVVPESKLTFDGLFKLNNEKH